MQVVGVSKPRTSGSVQTKNGKKAYRGRRKHWFVYFYDDAGKFRKKKISSVEVPYYGSLIRRRKTYACGNCGSKFKGLDRKCPFCGSLARRIERGPGGTTERKPFGKAAGEPAKSKPRAPSEPDETPEGYE